MPPAASPNFAAIQSRKLPSVGIAAGPHLNAPYRQVTTVGNGLKRVVLAGQVGLKPDGAIAGDLGAQIEQAWDNLLSSLASEKLGPEHLVKIVYFTTVNTPEALKISREIRARKLGDLAPSSTYRNWPGLRPVSFRYSSIVIRA